MMKSKIALALAAGVAQNSAGAAQVIAVTTPPEVVGINGADLYRARNVLRRFFASERHPECYRVLFSEMDGNLSVEFVPRQPRYVVMVEGEREPAVEPRCGRNVGYVLDRNGNVLHQIYSR